MLFCRAGSVTSVLRLSTEEKTKKTKLDKQDESKELRININENPYSPTFEEQPPSPTVEVRLPMPPSSSISAEVSEAEK